MGDQRYFNKQWPANQQRVMIVLSNFDPDYGRHSEAVASRFHFVRLPMGAKLYEPSLDGAIYLEEESKQP